MTLPLPEFAALWSSRADLRITGVRSIVTAPEGIPLVVVRVDTSEPGLYGLGCATFTQRWRSVVSYVDDHLARLVVGRYPGDIEDLIRLCRFSGYWRDGAVDNNALSGIDMALWDIAGKRAGMPVYELLGGRARAAADTYIHASGRSFEETAQHTTELRDAGWRHIRIQVSQPGRGGYGAGELDSPLGTRPHAPNPSGWDVGHYLRQTPLLFDAVRSELGDTVELLHDVHSRLTPKQAVMLARSVEEYTPYFLEDVVAPEHWDRLPEVRAASPVPIAVGELATSAAAATRLVTGTGVDFIRCHISTIGGLTPARKLAAVAEAHGVQTAWHSPGDASPIAAAANATLDVTSPAFGIQEAHVFSDAAHEVFPGTLAIENGWIAPNDAPGWGIELNEAAAARFPPALSRHDAWAASVRAADGSLIAP